MLEMLAKTPMTVNAVITVRFAYGHGLETTKRFGILRTLTADARQQRQAMPNSSIEN